jgi:aryl-alcohol dehydrogenase-like predicted oxidoreductase
MTRLVLFDIDGTLIRTGGAGVHAFGRTAELLYGVAGVADWTAEAVTRGIEEARTTLHSDVLDVVHLHSCPGHVACRDDIQDALEAARDSGHVAVIGYAGEILPAIADAANLPGRVAAYELDLDAIAETALALLDTRGVLNGPRIERL